MRRANDSAFIVHEGTMIGVNLGADFTVEHECGITEIKHSFSIPEGDTDFGITRRKIRTVPSFFGWTKGAEKGSEGFYLWDTWDEKVPSFAKNSELMTYGGQSLACAWDEGSFGVFSTDAKEIAMLKEIYKAFKDCDGAVFLSGGRLFGNSGLCLVIASRLLKEVLDLWYVADKDAYGLDQEVEATGIRQLLKEKGKHYYSLSRPRHRTSDGALILWLNPMEQHRNNFGWFTIDDLKDWAEGKGKIPIIKTVKE